MMVIIKIRVQTTILFVRVQQVSREGGIERERRVLVSSTLTLIATSTILAHFSIYH